MPWSHGAKSRTIPKRPAQGVPVRVAERRWPAPEERRAEGLGVLTCGEGDEVAEIPLGGVEAVAEATPEGQRAIECLG